MTATAADAPSRQLSRVKNGQEVGVITLQSRHRILADARHTAENKALVCRINTGGAYCWHHKMYTSVLDTYLSRADGAITTGNTRAGCPGWPNRYTNIGRRQS